MGEGERSDFRKGQWQRELQDCLAREVANWQAKPARQILLELDDTSCGYSGGYEVLFLGAAYHVCVRLLDADAQVKTIHIDCSPMMKSGSGPSRRLANQAVQAGPTRKWRSQAR